jgi:Omp85 superfamily domain
MRIHTRGSAARSVTALWSAPLFVLAAFPVWAAAQTRQVDPSELTSVSVTPGEADGLWREPAVIARSIDFATRVMGDGGEGKTGFYPELSNMITGAGWISAGPGYRHWLAGDQVFVDASTAISWRSYKMAQARFELPHLARSHFAVGSHVRWQDLTQITYFGEGAETPEAARSEYRLKSTNIVGYATVRPIERLALTYRVGWLARPALLAPAGRFQRGHPPTQAVFPEDPAFALSQQPNYGYVEASLAYDTRDHRSHPTHGGVYRTALTSYTDRTNRTFSFDRGEVEAAHFFPMAGSRVVVAVHGWLVASSTEDGALVPFYLLPSLGGHNTLRGYADYRFHDRNLLVVNLESRVAVFPHVDAAVFADAGNVAARVSGLDLGKRTYGLGLRLHSRQSTFARFDAAHGPEGWRFLFRLNDPLHLSRLSRRTAAIPFVP